MSNAEVILGAKLYVDAVNAGLPELLKEDADRASGEQYRNLTLAMRDMSRALVKNKAVVKDPTEGWVVNDEGIGAMGEDAARKFAPFYETVVMAHEKVANNLIADGKKDYVADFREGHAQAIFEIMPETATRIRGQDMQAVASASLSLLEAVHEKPQEMAFVKGLDPEAIGNLRSVMEKANYLMPGENPDRQTPLSEQALRGSPEEQEAIYFQASAIISNLDLPDTIRPGDNVAAAAIGLKRAVVESQTETIETDRLTGTPKDMYFDSDLTREDANTLFNLVNAGTRLVHKAQYDTESLGTLLVPEALAEDVRIALDDYADKGIEHALSSGNFEAPNIDSDTALRIAAGINWLREAVTTDAASMEYTGDDGGALTMEGATTQEGNEFDNAFDADERDDDEAQSEASEPAAHGEEMGVSAYGRAEQFVRLNESMIHEWDTISLEMLGNGITESLRRQAGRADIDLSDLESGKAAFGSLEDAIGADRVATTPEITNTLSEAMSATAWEAMNPERRARLRVVKIEAGRGAFKDYVHGAPDVAARRMTRFLDDNMLTEEGKPNLDLRRLLRDASQQPVVGNTRQEAEAFRGYAEKFVEREREEFQQRQEAARQKRGVSSFELKAEDVSRFIDVAEASGSDQPARVNFSSEGKVTISHPDAPRLTSELSKVPDEFRKADKSKGRPFGGHIAVDQLKAAYQTGAETITVMVDGERPYAAIGKLQEEPEKTKAATKAKKWDQMVLS